MNDERKPSLNFIEQIILRDREAGKHDGRVCFRFPPEPNGYLHIGHAKAICLNFGLAEKYGGPCNLRFDDTNPAKESTEYVDAIKENIRWLGFDWEDRLFFASDYFEQLYQLAEQLIEKGLAFVCDLDATEMREYRGTLTSPGKNSPYRDRSVEENLTLFRGMRAGEFEDGTHTLRAKIDMASPNMNLRDPVMYRITRVHHHRTGDEWCIYPTYDWTHGQSDSIEGITHSLCTLEFENHRPLYNWYIESLGIHAPQQIESARLEITHILTSKRKLLQLVEDGIVSGWDDPRMPTLAGLRRRGYTPESIRSLMETVGVAKYNSTVDMVLLENAIRNDLNPKAPRRMAVLDPLKVVITNWPEGEVDEVDAINNPEDESAGKRKVPFSGTLYVERDDFREEAPRNLFRLAPGKEVRLRYAYYITCDEVVKDEEGNVVELRCSYDPESRGGNTPDGRKVKGTIHWVSADHALAAEVRVYDHLFANPDPSEGDDFLKNLNPQSLKVTTGQLEPSLSEANPGERYQFERSGYYCLDPDTAPGKPVFNRTVSLRDSWAKIEKKQAQGQQKKQKQGKQKQGKQKQDPNVKRD